MMRRRWRIEGAIEVCRGLEERFISSGDDVVYFRGCVCARAGEWGRSRDVFDYFEEVFGGRGGSDEVAALRVMALLGKGNAFSYEGRYDEAEAVLRGVMALCADSPVMACRKGRLLAELILCHGVLEAQGRVSEAVEVLEGARARTRGEDEELVLEEVARVYFNLVVLRVGNGEVEEARAVMEEMEGRFDGVRYGAVADHVEAARGL